MKIEVNRKHIEDTMRILGSIAGRRWPDMFSAIQFEAAAGKLTACAFNGNVYCSADIDAAVDGAGSAMLKADALVGLVAAAPVDDLRMSFAAGATTLQAGRAKYRIQTLLQSDISPPIVHKREWLALPADKLREGLTFVTGHCAVKDVRSWLEAAYIHIAKGCLTIIGSDGYRMAKWTSEVAVEGNATALIPQPVLQRLVACLPDTGDVELSLTDLHVGLRANGLLFDCKQVDCRAPDYDRVTPMGDGQAHGTLKVQSLAAALRRASIVIRGSVRNGARFFFGPEPRIEYVDVEASADEPFDCESQGAEVEVGLSVPYVLAAMEAFGEAEEVGFAVHESSLRLDGDGRTIVIMQMRL